MATTGKRRYWYAVEWPYGENALNDDGSDAVVLWRFTSQRHRDRFVRDGSALFGPSYACVRTTYDGVAARKQASAYELLPDGSDYQVVDL